MSEVELFTVSRCTVCVRVHVSAHVFELLMLGTHETRYHIMDTQFHLGIKNQIED